MTPDVLLAAGLFMVASSITPGPNNTMLMASGVNFGFKRSLRHLAGVNLGFGFMVLCVGLGLHTVLQDWPALYDLLRALGGAYLLWIAYKLARSTTPIAATPTPSETASWSAPASAQPIGFWEAAVFQWVNPKAWMMAVTCMSTYLAPQAEALQVVLLAGLFLLLGSPCSVLWVGFGKVLRHWLQQPTRQRWFNRTMAAALVLSLYPMLTP
ncbi:LysE family translocator [Curvibacter sp. CHRR-16]|uniref:LysE family translocator n=1 Tax=Curvibacter sp. CHRR-16 TaxID=2835872 RepID=UPI001BD9AF79|nr:LysE family translocator [Curvibacter sp. CHRR-16]MBT0569848.1 LysE family translocator [Curvibacter sp. CHRR-16]